MYTYVCVKHIGICTCACILIPTGVHIHMSVCSYDRYELAPRAMLGRHPAEPVVVSARCRNNHPGLDLSARIFQGRQRFFFKRWMFNK